MGGQEVKITERFLLMSHRVMTTVMSLGVSVAMAATTDNNVLNNVWEGDVDTGLKALDRAVSLAIVIGLVIVAIGFVIGAIKYFHEDIQGSKDVLLKCTIAGVVVALAPTLVKFIVGSFAVRNLADDLTKSSL